MTKTHKRICGKCGSIWYCLGCENGLLQGQGTCWCLDCLVKLGAKTKIKTVKANSKCFTLNKEKVIFT